MCPQEDNLERLKISSVIRNHCEDHFQALDDSLKGVVVIGNVCIIQVDQYRGYELPRRDDIAKWKDTGICLLPQKYKLLLNLLDQQVHPKLPPLRPDFDSLFCHIIIGVEFKVIWQSSLLNEVRVEPLDVVLSEALIEVQLQVT